MRLPALLLIAITCLLTTPPAARADEPPTGAYIVRVMAPPTEFESPCGGETADGGDLMCIRFDVTSRVRTEVVQVIAGPDPGPQLQFTVADHYGLPKLADYAHALVVVTMGPGEPWMERYLEVPLLRLADGGWATCGELRDYPAMPLQFAEDLGSRTAFARSRRAQLIPRGSTRLRNGRVECTKGVRVQEAYAALRAVHVSRGGAALPETPAVWRDAP